MERSDQINEIAAALAKAQEEIQNVAKDKSGYGYKYADLASVLEIARPALSKNGIALIQSASYADQSVSVTTTLAHQSGQWVSSTIAMPVQVGKGMSYAQAIGSVITYARRYLLAAMVGIAQEDNDAAIVDGQQQQHQALPQQPQKRAPNPVHREANLPTYTIEQARENLPNWAGKNPDGIINKIRTRYVVPDEVERFIRDNLEAAEGVA